MLCENRYVSPCIGKTLINSGKKELFPFRPASSPASTICGTNTIPKSGSNPLIQDAESVKDIYSSEKASQTSEIAGSNEIGTGGVKPIGIYNRDIRNHEETGPANRPGRDNFPAKTTVRLSEQSMSKQYENK